MRLFRRWTVPGQASTEMDSTIGSDMQSDWDALDHSEEQALDDLGADPADSSGLQRDPLARDGEFGNPVVGDMKAEEQGIDRTGDALQDKGGEASGA
jgi:hypothetical protein